MSTSPVTSGGGLGFPPEALQSLGTLRNLLWQELQRNMAAKSDVLVFINATHASAETTEAISHQMDCD